jgi:hypothetical protein
MKQIFLKFPDEKTGRAWLSDYFDEEGEPKDPVNYSIDVIGDINSISGEFPKLIVTKLDGWHVNMLVPDDFTSKYQIQPTSPRRIFAGW